MLKWRRTKELDAKSVAKSWQSYTVLILAMGAMLFFGVCHPSDPGRLLPTGAVASVDGVEIKAMEFRRAHKNMSDQYQQQFRDQFDPVAMGISQRVVDSLVDSTLLYLEAVQNGTYATDAEIEKIIIDGDYFKGENGSFDPKLFDRYLASQGHTEQSFTEEVRRNMIGSKFRNLVSSTFRTSDKVAEINYLTDETKLNVEYLRVDPSAISVSVTPAEVDAYLKDGGEVKVKEYFEKNANEYNQEKKVKARHILISFKESRSASGEAAKRSKEEARSLAEKVLQETKASGADFAKLAGKYTDDLSGKTKGGDLGFFKKEQMVKEFSDVAFSLQPGAISGIVESPFGFHIIRVDAVQEAKLITLDQARREIAEKLLIRDRKPQLLNTKVTALLAAVKENKAEALMKELQLSWKETGDFGIGARSIPGGIGSEKSARTAVVALKKPGDIAPEALDISGARYILRLKAKTSADLSKLEPTKRKELAESSKAMEAYGLFNALTSELRKKYESEGKIYKNPQFVQYDALLHQKPEE